MSVHFNEQKISEKSVHSLVYNQWMCSSVFSYLSDSAPCWLILFKLFDRIGLLGCWGPCSSSLDASVCYTFCTTWTKDVLSLQFGWQGQYQHPHTQVSLMSRTNRSASNWDDTPCGISNILRCCMLSKNVPDKTLSKQRPQVLSWVNCFRNTNQLGGMVFRCRVRTGHGKPGKSWNLRISFPGLESHEV